LPPALGERAGIDGVVADRIEERGRGRLRLVIIARDRLGRAVVGAMGLASDRR
jgi:hypothetical protein